MSDWNWTGAKWWKFDFHCHTPMSDDYGKGPNQAQEKQISPKDWLLNYMRAGIDCIAVTDHNSGAWIDSLKRALVEIATENPSGSRPLYIFPGVELSVQGNIHILAIFPFEKTTSDIDSLLGAVKYRTTRGKSDGCSECSATEAITEITNLGGLAIPSHVDQPTGLFKVLTGTTLEQILGHRDLIAMEVIDTAVAKPTIYTDKKINLSEVLGSDSHHTSGTGGQSYPGSRFTWVKMSEPSFDGLRLALIDGELSLKRSDHFTSDPNTHGPVVLESITVDNAKYLGRGTSFICKLNPWLNTVIGGRGTGKSTILEFLRIALNRQHELPRSLEREFSKYNQPSINREDEGLLKDSTILHVYYRKDGGRFRIKWTQAEPNYSIEQETSLAWTTSQGDIAQRFPIRIYSQKQIFELAKHPQALLRVIDDSTKVNYREWKQEWDELITKYFSIRAQEREVQAGLHEESVIKGQLDDIKRKLEVFEKAGHADVLKSYQLSQDQNKSIENWEKAWTETIDRVRSLASRITIPDFDFRSFSEEMDEYKELHEAVNSISVTFQTLQADMLKYSERIEEAKHEWLTKKLSLSISKKIADANQKYTDLLTELSHAGAGDPSAYGHLVSQRQALEEKLDSFNRKREQLKEHQKNADECLKNISEHRSKLTKKRVDFLNKILTGNAYVKIQVVPYGSVSTVEEELRNLLERDTGFERDIGSVDTEEGLIGLLCKKTDPVLTCVEAIKMKLFAIRDNTLTDVADRRFIAHVQGLSHENLDRLRCWFPEDSLDIQYSLKEGGGFKPIEQGSPGQKTAALLAFILSYGNEPLILDQPEDDLDNHLIYGLIVTQLREIKQQRQVLVVTHNANIVVNGDAENVLALDIANGQTKIVAQGSLQERSIRDQICQVMEGGKEAFDQRYKRIRWNKSH